MVSRSTPPRPPAPQPELTLDEFIRWSMKVSDLGAATGRRSLGGMGGRVYLGGQLWIQHTPGGYRTMLEGQETLATDLRTLEQLLYEHACEQGLCRRPA